MKITTNLTIMSQLLLLLFICGYSSLAPAGVYRWVDANGQVHFGERPPTGTEADEVQPPPPPALSPELGSELRKQFEQRQADYTTNRKATKKAQQEAADQAAERARNCAQSRAAINSINQFMNKRMFDDEGNYIEQPAREKKLAKAQESVEYWCD
ncbi:MAG: DUF4124 domain-containing protein [Gammaproteobacteria bacterium]